MSWFNAAVVGFAVEEVLDGVWTKIPGGGGRERLMIIPKIIFIIFDYT